MQFSYITQHEISDDNNECIYVHNDKCLDKRITTQSLRRCRYDLWTITDGLVPVATPAWVTDCSQSPTATQPHITPTPLKAPPGFWLNQLTENKRSIYSRVLNRPLQYTQRLSYICYFSNTLYTEADCDLCLYRIQLEFNTGSGFSSPRTQSIFPLHPPCHWSNTIVRLINRKIKLV